MLWPYPDVIDIYYLILITLLFYFLEPLYAEML